MDAAHARTLLEACCLLFDAPSDPLLLARLRPEGLRAAWKRRALQTHPDRVPDPAAKRRATERFIRASRAYELLRDFLGQREPRAPRPQPPHRRRRHHRPAPPHRPPPRPRPGSPEAILPRRPLRTGEFLMRTRVITFDHLVGAIVWQRRQRERFCEICLRWGLLTPAQSRRLLERRGLGEPVGAAARRLRLLSAAQVGAVLALQRRRQRPIGEYFLERGLLDAAALEALLARLAAHNASCRRPS